MKKSQKKQKVLTLKIPKKKTTKFIPLRDMLAKLKRKNKPKIKHKL
jgi:hypothetical protein